MKELAMHRVSDCVDTADKTTLRKLASQLPNGWQGPMLLGLDGDCDFSCALTSFLPHMCGKDELLALIDRESSEALYPVYGLPGFVVLCRRHALWVPSLFQRMETGG